MTRKEQAMEYFKEGYNCAQSVFLAFCDLTGFDKITALHISAPFGGGFGRQREVCGAVSGMCMALGVLYGYDDATDTCAKAAHYKAVQDICAEFRHRVGSIICRELLNLSKQGVFDPVSEKRTAEYYQKRPCIELVGLAAKLAEEDLQV